MGIFSLRRSYAEKLEEVASMFKVEQEQRIENQRQLVELLEKSNKKQARTEVLCEDILNTVSEYNDSDVGDPYGLLAGIMECFELLARYSKTSEDTALAEQVPLLEQKVLSLLDEYGIERINETGIKADLTLHKIERTAEPPALELDKTVAAIISPGYRLKGKVIQKAKITAYVHKNSGNTFTG